MGITAIACPPPKHNTNQTHTIALSGGYQIKAGGIRIACLNPIRAIKAAQQLVMIAVFAPFISEARA